MKFIADFIDVINCYMAEENITINKFSERVGIAGAAITKWLTMEYYPTVACICKVADLLDCSIDYMFNLTNDKSFTPSKLNEQFIDRFELLIANKNLTMYRVYKDCHIGNSSIYKWRKGNYPKTETIYTLANYFNCSMDYLIGRSDLM